MIEKMRGTLHLTVPDDVDLTEAEDILVVLDQPLTNAHLEYEIDRAHVLDSHTLYVTIPKSDAMKLDDTMVDGQVFWTISGAPQGSDIFHFVPSRNLKEDGYGV